MLWPEGAGELRSEPHPYSPDKQRQRRKYQFKSEPGLPSVSSWDEFFTPRNASAERVAKARRLSDGRKARETLFSRALFGEPAWDLSLYLYMADKCVCTAELPARMGMAHSIIGRWIAVLEGQGLLARSTHPDLPFTIALDLTDEAYRLMDAYLDGQ